MATYNGQKYSDLAVSTPAPGSALSGQDSVPTPKPGEPLTNTLTPQPVQQPALPQAPQWGTADANQSPSYLAFLRGAGMSEAQAQTATGRQKLQLQAQLEAQRPVWAQSLEQGLQGALNNAAARGVNRSSNRIANQNLVQQGVNQQQASAEANTANQIGNLDLNLQNTLAGLANQKGEASLRAQQEQYQQRQQNYENELANYYLQQLLNGGQ